MTVSLVGCFAGLTDRPQVGRRIEPGVEIRRGSTVSGAADPHPSWASGPRWVRATFVDPLRIRAIPLSAVEQSWIAEVGGRTAGCVSLGDGGDGSAELLLVMVESEYRGLGLGRRLVHEALAFATRTRYREVRIRWDDAAPGVDPWLLSLGFRSDPGNENGMVYRICLGS